MPRKCNVPDCPWTPGDGYKLHVSADEATKRSWSLLLGSSTKLGIEEQKLHVCGRHFTPGSGRRLLPVTLAGAYATDDHITSPVWVFTNTDGLSLILHMPTSMMPYYLLWLYFLQAFKMTSYFGQRDDYQALSMVGRTTCWLQHSRDRRHYQALSTGRWLLHSQDGSHFTKLGVRWARLWVILLAL